MSLDQAQFLAETALWVMFLISLPVLAITSLVSLVLSILQAVTQIQDQTLLFAIKFFTVVLILTMTGGWMAGHLSSLFVDALTLSERSAVAF